MQEAGNSRIKGILKWVPGILISLGAFYLVFRMVDWGELVSAIARFKVSDILLAVLLTLVWLLVRALTWCVLLEEKVNIKQAFLALNVGYLSNNLIPRAGEIARAIFLGQIGKTSPFLVLSTVVIERAFDLAIAAGLFLGLLPLALKLEWARQAAVSLLLVVIAGLVGLFLVARYPQFIHKIIAWIGNRWKFVEKYIAPRMDSLLDGLKVLTDPKRFVLSFGLILASWGIAFGYYFLMLRVLAPQAPFWWAAFSNTFVALAGALPSAPAGIGVFEWAVTTSLSVFGIEHSLALAFAAFIHAIQIVITSATGLLALFIEGHSLGTLFTEIKSGIKGEAQQ